ncbi:MAG: type I 3-dehydroquinate dehydratase, partial [Candidatus Heimdallarchaeota archaeon]
SHTSVPIILTVRSEWTNISINPPGAGRRDLLENLIKLHPDFIDLEFPIDTPLINKVPKDMKIILSLIDWDGIVKIAFEVSISIEKNYDNVIVKIIAKPHTVSDLKQLWKWSKQLHKKKIPNIIIGLGELGKITRIKSLEMKNAWMYGKIGRKTGEPYLPGMLSVKTLQQAFADNSWHLASFGNHSDEEAEFNESLIREIMSMANLSGVYLNLPISNRAELDQLLLWVNDGLLDGVKILSQWKREVISKLDRLDASGIHTQEVNCVVISKDGLLGYNTDVEAIRRILRPYAIKSIKRVYIEGEELHCRALITALRDTAELIVVRARDESKLKRILEDFPSVLSAKDSFTDHFDLVVNNQIPEIGFERVSPIPPKKLRNSRIVFDPSLNQGGDSETIKLAKSQNLSVVDGWDFYVNSAIITFELWTNKSIPSSELSKEKISFANRKLIEST